MTGSCQWVEIQKMEEILTVLNFHGLWQEGTGKVDTRKDSRNHTFSINF